MQNDKIIKRECKEIVKRKPRNKGKKEQTINGKKKKTNSKMTDNIIKWKWHKVANKNTEIISLDKSETLLYYVNKNTILNIKSQVKNKRMEKINMSTLIIKQLEWL